MKPKFEVGDLVAVSDPYSMTFFHSATVEEAVHLQPGQQVIDCDGRLFNSSETFVYQVDADRNFLFPEFALRKINPDEYIETEATQEETA